MLADYNTLYPLADGIETPLGQLSFAEAEASGRPIRRVVHCWIQNQQGEWLFQFRSRTKPNEPRHYDCSVGGGVKDGESEHDAAIREAQEELGITITPVYAGRHFFDVRGGYTSVAVFHARHTGEVKGWEAEAEAVEWFKVDEAQSLMKRLPYLFCCKISFGILQALGQRDSASHE